MSKAYIYKYNLSNIFFLLFFLIYLGVLIKIGKQINISEDESYSLATSSLDFLGVVKQSNNFELQPPGYFLFLSWWRILSPSIFFAKLFSICCILLSSYSFFRLTSFFTTSKLAKWMVVIFLLNPFTIWAALEIRTYALLILLSTISGYLFLNFLFNDKKKSFYLLILVGLVGVYTQYFFSFLLISFAIVALFYKGWNTFLRFCLYGLLIAVLLLPNLFFLSNQIETQQFSDYNYSLNSINQLIVAIRDLILPLKGMTSVWLVRLIKLTLILSGFFIYTKAILKREKDAYRFINRYNVILLMVLISSALYFAGFSITKVLFEAKYLSLLYPWFILILIIYCGINFNEIQILYVLMGIWFVFILFKKYEHPVNTYDFKSAGSFIQKIESANEPIFIYRPAIALPFQHYYHGSNKIIPLPNPVNFDSSYIVNIKDTVELRNSLQKAMQPEARSFFLFGDTTENEGSLNMNREMVDHYLKTNYNLTLDTFLIGWGKEKSLRLMRFQKQIDE